MQDEGENAGSQTAQDEENNMANQPTQRILDTPKKKMKIKARRGGGNQKKWYKGGDCC